MAKKVYILSELMRAAKSGYWIEGTDIQMDFPDFYPIPFETEVLEQERPVALRLLPHCPYLEREKQIKNGYPERYVWNDQDRQRLTFKFRRLELDDKRDKIYIEFLERTAWMQGNENKMTRPEQKTIFLPFDEDKVVENEIADEEEVTGAKAAIFRMDPSTVRNLYRLANPGVKTTDGLTTINTMKKNLLAIAGVNPQFITMGVKSTRDNVVVTASRAIDASIVSLDFPGICAIFNEHENEWQSLLSVSDDNGPEGKFDRLIDYLLTEQGATDLAIIENKLQSAPVLDND